MSDIEGRLRQIEVEIRYTTGGSDRTTVKVRPNDSFRRIRRHISESLDVQGSLSYGSENLDNATRKIADYEMKEGKHLCMTCSKKKGTQYTIRVQLPFGSSREEVKISMTTTINSLKHKIQDRWGIPVEEQTICMLGSPIKCQGETNIMRFKQPCVLEVLRRDPVSSHPGATRVSAATGTKPTGATKMNERMKKFSPYETAGKRKGGIQNAKTKGRNMQLLVHNSHAHITTVEEETGSNICVALRHATFETIHQLGRNLEDFRKDKGKTLIIECKHKEDDKVDIKSKSLSQKSMS